MLSLLRDSGNCQSVSCWSALRASSAFFRISFPPSLQLLKRAGLCFKGSAVLSLMSLVTLKLGNGPKGGRLFATLLTSFFLKSSPFCSHSVISLLWRASPAVFWSSFRWLSFSRTARWRVFTYAISSARLFFSASIRATARIVLRSACRMLATSCVSSQSLFWTVLAVSEGEKLSFLDWVSVLGRSSIRSSYWAASISDAKP
mmetsp:Transcript_38619/g.65001  ORF Transcript_38619/g.65001 Transcript_38619/m.65001 type:complete len:202 (+) Transcript_38619:118-723(+)